MTTNHHTPHSTGDPLDASELNAVYSDLDSAISTNATDITTLQGQIAVLPGTAQGRLTLSSTLAVTTSDVTAATTLYYLPYQGETVALYDGVSAWAYHNLPGAGVSIAIPATTDTNYDVYLYDNASTLTLELVAWTDDTTRATALATQDGAYVKTGDTTRLYVGTIRTTGVSGECEDSSAFRYVWNAYNRVARRLVNQFSGNHSLTSTSFRAWNNDTANSVSVVRGVSENTMKVNHHGISSGAFTLYGIGVDSSTTNSATMTKIVDGDSGTGEWTGDVATYNGAPSAGYHQFRALEKVVSGTATVFGNAASELQMGLEGEVQA